MNKRKKINVIRREGDCFDSITLKEFSTAVWAQLCCCGWVPDSYAKDFINLSIEQMYEKGYTVYDTVATCICMEEVNPYLDEDVALRRMATIREQVKSRLASTK